MQMYCALTVTFKLSLVSIKLSSCMQHLSCYRIQRIVNCHLSVSQPAAAAPAQRENPLLGTYVCCCYCDSDSEGLIGLGLGWVSFHSSPRSNYFTELFPRIHFTIHSSHLNLKYQIRNNRPYQPQIKSTSFHFQAFST